ncbi:MAG: glycosyltransferase family 4 protein [Bacteroidia bacterium]|nr:glycosyltransferase family 4 protein [Bacteroidia bacterium]
MHILYIHQYFCPPGGIGNNRSLELARLWVQAGHKVTVLTSTAYFPAHLKGGDKQQDLEIDGIHVVPLAVPYSHLMRFRERVKAFLQFYRKARQIAKGLPKPDLIYASSTPPTVGELGRKLSRHWEIPFVFETVDVWPDVPIGMGIVKNPVLKCWLNRRVNRIYREASLIVALSDGMKEQILTHGVDPQKVIVSYNGTSLKAFPFQAREAKPNLKIIYTGTVGLANGVEAIVDVCKLLESRGVSEVEFSILGGGNDLARVKAHAANVEVKGLRFLDPVPKEQVADLLATADIGVVTFAPFSVLQANSANKFYDYLASGLPVLLNYQGWQAEYLEQWNCGRASRMGDLHAFADNIEWLLQNPTARSEMGKNARRLAESHFDRKKIAGDLLAGFQRILNSGHSTRAVE